MIHSHAASFSTHRSRLARTLRIGSGLALAAFALTAFALAHPPLARAANPGDVVINEVMQNPAAVADASGEWFELHNATTSPINIDGWTIIGGATESHTISAGGSLVIAANGFIALGRVASPATNGGYTPAYVIAGISLGNGSDLLAIRQGAVTIDSVGWDDGATFPDPDGATMELKDPLADNGIGANWAANTTISYGLGDFGTPGAQNSVFVGGGPGTPPAIANVVHVPASPIASDTVRIRADVTDNLSVAEVCVEYRINGGTSIASQASLLSGVTYEGKIPPFPAGTLVEYLVVARDGGGNVTLSPADAPSSMYSYTVGGAALTVSINEVLADPPTVTGDPSQGDVNGDGAGDSFQDEFVELVNYGPQPVDISGWTLSDDDAPGSEYTFPLGTILPSLGFVTLFGGGAPQGYTGFVFVDDGRIGNGLGNTGDTVELRRAGALVDVLAYGTEGGNNESMIRVPDGTGNWSTPSEESYSAPYSPHAPNGGGLIATQRGTWGKIKAIFQ